ncbi:MAG TPA: 3-hydroxyacyl-ACP dehydratase FabZ family protein [Vicinamibacterales bacterium]|nr:3-hydroxyacyl-ACP dehydratase FabZ family protein [Vicinamibacterales bacterium]
MLEPDELRRLIRTARREPLVPEGTGTPVSVASSELQRLLPHRPPMLLLDGVDAVDLARGAVRGHRRLQPEDLGFAGHFPGDPIYPGVLVVEAMGQLGLTLLHFAGEGRADVPVDATPRPVRATHVHHASFIASFAPGDTMVLHSQVAHNDYTFVAIGQAWKGSTLAAIAVSEVYVDV